MITWAVAWLLKGKEVKGDAGCALCIAIFADVAIFGATAWAVSTL